eukprot:365832-Chlamydomonas_euryale.AAC.10
MISRNEERFSERCPIVAPHLLYPGVHYGVCMPSADTLLFFICPKPHGMFRLAGSIGVHTCAACGCNMQPSGRNGLF